MTYDHFHYSSFKTYLLKNEDQYKRNKLKQNKEKIPDEKLFMGSTQGKYPVILDGGRTVVYIFDKSKEEETRKKYEQLHHSKYPPRFH